MNRRTVSQRVPPQTSTPAPILYPPSGPSSGRASPYPAPLSAGGPGSGFNHAPGTSNGLYQRSGSSASQYSESPFGGGMSSNGGYTRATHDVEGQNDERLEGLLGKVKVLKDITVGIGNEVRDGNLELTGMNDAFGSTSNFLNGTFRRMNKMAKKQGIGWCYFMLFLLFVLWIFVVVWWLRR
ncbi:hypothetical protein BD324DRAFT_629140 [Kockovaella imperatae]|uniref:t-SNARE coiled-coil homology domain-containing protein n=1 Tax=Kockovaella imperatae TaxID=4999 RepID=A0A1Y1UEM2_9TREE|nr:hypothetical protein BD324DRAFT_629140 [Kockovaella imperatae]ORX36510.1 hypothetical protein BD324DRAFT_629140 [Kockovaella imperatae]